MDAGTQAHRLSESNWTRPIPRFYRYVMAFIFAIDEINKNPDILPNMTLGYHVYDSCNNVNKAIDSALQILSGPGDQIPNFCSTEFGRLVGVIGDLNADTSFNIAQILRIYGYPQISYGAVDPILSNIKLFPSFFQALPNYSTQQFAIVQLLRHYNWTWIGVIASDDDVGEKQSEELKTMATNFDICIEYIIKIPDKRALMKHIYGTRKHVFTKSTSQVVVICSKISMTIIDFVEQEGQEKTFIIPAGWISLLQPSKMQKPSFHGSLIFSPPRKEMSDLKTFLQDISPRNRPHDFLVEYILAYFFHCLTSDELILVSTCSAPCPSGYKRTLKPGIHKCCFECFKCSEGEITDEKDSISCHKCPEDQWPNDFNHCVPKPIEFLSYKNDLAVVTVSVITILCFGKTSIILGIFTLFQDTPVVRANNQTLSFILLVSIMLSFLCVFLFLGCPTHVTCMLRQTSFGVIFSVAISSILAKTIMVYTAFKATKPGSSWRRFVGVKIPNSVVFFCSFVQVLLSVIWLSTSPPFPEMNTHLYQDKIIFQCNEGSMLAFFMLLGYMGLLAAISFIVAFLARNLPDSFNEAKNITFSMLVVCSVWVAFIPAYMSVTGKNTVLVEIFAIISSIVGRPLHVTCMFRQTSFGIIFAIVCFLYLGQGYSGLLGLQSNTTWKLLEEIH
ncbi:vomeronasal type-2 receptor 26-like [Engystomops pustulosus]|uniref:vomeronasal type-2 receptor 26-like n=1 Tax=Engystomops pustulosus TaxID=76066 RepID=UPI003AFB1904